MALSISAAVRADEILAVGFEECDGTTATSVQMAPAAWSELTGLNWPAPYGNAFALDIPAGRVISLAFTAGSGTAGSIELAERAGLPAAPAAISISRCVADFRDAALNNATQRCLVYNGSIQPKLYWKNGVSAPGSCGLNVGQRYYLNIAHYAVPLRPGAASTCNEASCGSWILSRSL